MVADTFVWYEAKACVRKNIFSPTQCGKPSTIHPAIQSTKDFISCICHFFNLIVFMQVFLDEATSSVDEKSEAQLYKELSHISPTIISIGHRHSLRALHTHELRLISPTRFVLEEIKD